MRKADVELGGTYIAKVSGDLVAIHIDRPSSYGGWDATNLKTGRSIYIRTAARLRRKLTSADEVWVVSPK